MGGLTIDTTDLDSLKKFNKDKKLVKKWAKKYDQLLASDTVLKKVPVVVGPILNRIGRFPQVVSHSEPLDKKIEDIMMALNFLVSLLKKGWHNLKSVNIKSTMGKP